jgi:hypothetical protein
VGGLGKKDNQIQGPWAGSDIEGNQNKLTTT